MNNQILSLIWEWRYVIIYVISAIIFALSMGREALKAKAYSLMLLAKKQAKDGILNSGQAQEDWVVQELYILLKKLKVPFISEEALRPLVHKLYQVAKDYLDDGKLNKSIE